jgi:phosphoglycolate phosphatase
MFFPENVIFDWDNTLVDSNYHLKWVMDETLQTLKNQGYLATKSTPCYWQMPLSKLFAKHPAYVAKKAAKVYISLYQELPYLRIRLFEGAHDILNFLLKNKVNLYIISNKKGCFVRREALNLNVHQYFKGICGAGDTNYQKPSKEIVEKTLEKPFCREKTLFVGDSVLDLQCATNAQIRCILISNEIKEKDKCLIILPDLKFFLGYLKMFNITKII